MASYFLQEHIIQPVRDALNYYTEMESALRLEQSKKGQVFGRISGFKIQHANKV